MKPTRRFASWRTLISALLGLTLLLAACGDDGSESSESSESNEGSGGDESAGEASEGSQSASEVTFRIGAIPDQDPERLQRTYQLLSDYLEAELQEPDGPEVTVEYVPVTEYQGAVSGFRVGDLDVVWFGGLTGVQARLEVEGAEAIVQRDIDERFTSVFIAAADSGIVPFDDVAGLSAVAGSSFTFGSESSTSGRLMPQSFLAEAGIEIGSGFAGAPGFSGSHDATIELVAAGTYQVGALNSQVWDTRVAEGVVDTDQVIEIFRTPEYYDYHWVAQPDLDARFGDGFDDRLVAALTSLDINDPGDAAILDLFGAESFIPTDSENYSAIEAVAVEAGMIRP